MVKGDVLPLKAVDEMAAELVLHIVRLEWVLSTEEGGGKAKVNTIII